MLKFIFGRAATGKTYEILNLIEKSVDSGENPVLLVPEQFSFQSEKAVFERLTDARFQKASVMSFSRLCDELERRNGNLCGKTLTDADKQILIKRAVGRVKDELMLWSGYANSSGFSKGILEAIEEFKEQAILPEDLRYLSQITKSEKLKNKLHDTSLIFSAYNELIAESFIDPSNRLDKLYFNLQKDSYFESRPVFIDSFDGFTGQQFRIIDCILATSPKVTISLTYDINDKKEYGILRNIRKTYEKIKGIAQKYAIDIAEPLILKENRYESLDLKNLESLMFGEKVSDNKAQSVTVCKAQSIFDEAEFAARNIRRIVREQGARYSDFVIIARETEIYEQALKIACDKNKVACFSDKRISLSSMPIAIALLSAVEAVPSFKTDKIFRFLKSGIGVLEEDDISELENYTYVWNISGKKWTEEWDMNPDGLSQNMSPVAKAKLKKINVLREKAIKPLIKLANDFKGTPTNMSTALVRLLENCDAPKNLNILAEKNTASGEFDLADAIRSSWDTMMSILNSMVVCFNDANVSAKEYVESLKASISFATVGVIPQMIDEVTFGSADRIRPSRPKYAFILGANQGVFPKQLTHGGIFAASERRAMIDLGLDITDATLDTASYEDFLVYANTCCAINEVYISYSSVLSDGSAGHPSAFLESILKSLEVNKIQEPMKLETLNAPETLSSAFTEFCKRTESGTESASILKGTGGELDSSVNEILNGGSNKNASITPKTAKALFGSTIKMSPTKFDDFNHCRFKYFCKYGLRAKKLYPAEFSAMQRGTLIHYVLERVIEEYGKEVSQFDFEKCCEMVDIFTDEYLDSINGYRNIENERMSYLVSNIRRSLYYVLERISKEFAQSKFEPVSCELKIGDDGEIPAINIPVEDYGNIVLNGTVDRLDRYGAYIRVIDYKSGSKTFKLPDILYGQNMQMLLYLYTLSQNEKYGGTPAGVLYVKAKRVNDGKPSQRRMNGIVLANEDVVHAMEEKNGGEFIPKFNPEKQSDAYLSGDEFNKIFDFIGRKLKSTAKTLFEGNIGADPIDGLESKACEYCDFAAVCRIEKRKHKGAVSMSKQQVLNLIEKEEQDGI